MAIEPTERDIGRRVIYSPHPNPVERYEIGQITGFNEFFVFVRYGHDTGSKATRRDDLDWAGG